MPPSAAAYAPLERDGEPGHADAPTDGSVAAPEAEAPLGTAGTDEPAQLEPSEVAEQPMEADGTGGGSSDVAAATTQELGSKTVEQVVGIAAATLRKHSLPRVHFTVGVLNALFKAFVLGAFPQKVLALHGRSVPAPHGHADPALAGKEQAPLFCGALLGPQLQRLAVLHD